MFESGLHFDLYQFAGRRNRPASKETSISFEDYGRMSTRTRHRNLDRRLPTPAWALSDVWLRKLLILFLETRAQMRPSKDDLLTRRDIAERQIKKRLPQWNATVDTLQHEYVEARREGASKEALKNMEVEIENLDTLIRVTQKGTLATLAAVVVLYYRMRKDSVEVAEELQLKPPHVRMLLYRLNEIWNKNFNLDFTVEPAAPEVPPCRSYTREEIEQKLATGEITIPKDKPPLQLPPENEFDRRKRLGLIAKPPKILHTTTQSTGTPLPKKKIDPKLAVELRATGLSWKEIAARFGVHPTSVGNALRAAGLAVPRRSGPNPNKASERTERRHRLIENGYCGTCGKNPRGEHNECSSCRAYFAQKAKEAYARKKMATATTAT